MAMPLGDHGSAVHAMCSRSGRKVGGIGAQSHGPADRIDAEKIAQLEDHRIGRALFELRAVGFCEPADVARVFDDSALHAETDSEIRHFLFTGILNGANHSCDAAPAEAAWNQDSVIIREPRGT